MKWSILILSATASAAAYSGFRGLYTGYGMFESAMLSLPFIILGIIVWASMTISPRMTENGKASDGSENNS